RRGGGALRPYPRAAGRDPWLHRVRAVELQARQHADGVAGAASGGRVTLLPHPRRVAALPRQLRPRPGLVVQRGQEDRPDRAPVSGRPVFGENTHLPRGPLKKTRVAEVEPLIGGAVYPPAQPPPLYEIGRVAEGPAALANLGADVPLFVESLRELPAEYPAEL